MSQHRALQTHYKDLHAQVKLTSTKNTEQHSFLKIEAKKTMKLNSHQISTVVIRTIQIITQF